MSSKWPHIIYTNQRITKKKNRNCATQFFFSIEKTKFWCWAHYLCSYIFAYIYVVNACVCKKNYFFSKKSCRCSACLQCHHLCVGFSTRSHSFTPHSQTHTHTLKVIKKKRHGRQAYATHGTQTIMMKLLNVCFSK